MATKKNVNSHIQVKELNNKRWVCERVIMTEDTRNGDYDFIDNADGKLWKKIRPWKKNDLSNTEIAGQSNDDVIDASTNSYTNDGYAEDYFE